MKALFSFLMNCFYVFLPAACWLWDLLRVLEDLDVDNEESEEDSEEPILLALEMVNDTGVTGGESSCVRKMKNKRLGSEM